MKRVLITAFEPYDVWNSNASWSALIELTKNLPAEPSITTRLYPVDYDQMIKRVAQDYAQDYDFALHLGQAPGTSCIQLESIAVNIAHIPGSDQTEPIAINGPVAYRTTLPLEHYHRILQESGIPNRVSYFAGTYLCNALFYYSRYLCEHENLSTQSAFIHVPLEIQQVAERAKSMPSLPVAICAEAIRLILLQLASIEAPDS